MMALNSALKEKKSSAALEIRRGSESKTSIHNKNQGKPEAEFTQERPKTSPERQVKNVRKIPRLRPATAVGQVTSNHLNPKVDQNKTYKKLTDKLPNEKSKLRPPSNTRRTNAEHAAKETPALKPDKCKVDEINSMPQNPIGLRASPNYKGNSTVVIGSSKDEPSLGGGKASQKSKDLSKKRMDMQRISFLDNETGNSPKKCSQDSQKAHQISKSKNQNNEQLKKKSNGEKLKEALKEDFSSLLPLYQTEMKKITDVWVNTIYSSLTMRSHLVKLLVDAFPNINTAQFQTEDDRLLKCIAHAKAYTEIETENLVQFIRFLIKSQNSVKEENESLLKEREIANLYSNDWNMMTKKLADLAEETRKLQMLIQDEEKRKEIYEKKMKEKIRETESSVAKKEEEMHKLANQLATLKQKEQNFRGNIAMKLGDYNDIKADIESLKTIEQEYEDVKSTYLGQNEMYKKNIYALESLLEEKKKTLDKEKLMKKQLQSILRQLQEEQQRLRKSIGSEQVDFLMGRAPNSTEKNREQLWIAAVKLVLKGFMTQMKKLERDKNKMLLELQSNDLGNFKNIAATILRKDYFIKSIVSQMLDFHKSCSYSNAESCKNACA